MKAQTKIIHQVASCMVCGKHWEDYNNARKKAYAHAKKTGHRVRGETGTAFNYN